MMRDLAISYGNSRQAKKWVNKTISFDALKERLKTTIRTTKLAEEYAKMSKAQRDAAKDHGGFVGGTLKGGRRKIDTVELRSMIALDGDRIDKAFLDNYETNAPYTSVLYTTHSSTEDSPRVRIIFPMTFDVSSEEFVAVSRYVAQALDIDFFDECSYQPNQLMYWPSTPQNGVFVYKETDKGWLDPDVILSAHSEWTDPTRLPTSSRESKANTVTQQKVQDPLTKEGVVGLFNRVFFPVTKALEAFLSDVYEPTDNPKRWHLIESRSIAGVEIKDDKFVYSHHAKDPAYLKLCNAFDIVRIHRFGDDDKASFRAMCDFAMQQEDVKLLAANERLAEAEADFADAGDDDWKKRLKYQPRTSLLENSVYNLNLILANDPDFRNFAFNDMANRIQVTGPLPWERPKGNQFWRDADTAQLKSIILTNEKYIGDALLQKTYTVSVLDKKRSRNDGVMPKYYVEGCHEAIIDRETFLLVQEEIARRSSLYKAGKKRVYSSKYALTGNVICAHCDNIYRRVVWSVGNEKPVVWRCVSRLTTGQERSARTVPEEDLHAAIASAVNMAYSNRDDIIPVLKENIENVVGCDVDDEIEVIDGMIRKSQMDLLDAGRDEARVQEIGERIVSLRERRQNVLTQAALRKDEIDRIKAMIGFIEEQTGEAEYSEALVRSMIEKVTIHDDRITVEFKSGLAIDVDA